MATCAAFASASIGALLMLSLLANTRDIWKNKDAFHKCIRPFWFTALIATATTVFLASCYHIVLAKPLFEAIHLEWSQVRQSDFLQLVVIVILTAFLTAAPIAVSFTWKKFLDEDESGDS